MSYIDYFVKSFKDFGLKQEDEYKYYENIIPLIRELTKNINNPMIDPIMDIIENIMVRKSDYDYRATLNNVLDKFLPLLKG